MFWVDQFQVSTDVIFTSTPHPDQSICALWDKGSQEKDKKIVNNII